MRMKSQKIKHGKRESMEVNGHQREKGSQLQKFNISHLQVHKSMDGESLLILSTLGMIFDLLGYYFSEIYSDKIFFYQQLKLLNLHQSLIIPFLPPYYSYNKSGICEKSFKDNGHLK